MASSMDGFAALAAKLKGLRDPKEVGRTLKTGVSRAMNDVAKVARQYIPEGIDAHKTYKGRLVAPGFAKRSIRVISKVDSNGQRAYALLGVRAEAYYAVQFVELGTSKMYARLWLRPAFNASKDPMIKAVGGEINDWIKGVAAQHTAAGRATVGAQLLRST